jgi:hypothetical protein
MTVALIYKRDDRRKEPRRAQGKGGSHYRPHPDRPVIAISDIQLGNEILVAREDHASRSH